MEDQHEMIQETTVKPTFGQTMKVFIPAAAVSTIGLEAVLHAPLPLAIGGIVGSYILARNSPDLYEKLRGHVPGLPEKVTKERKPGEYTFTDRLLGKHMRDGATTVLPVTSELAQQTVLLPETEVTQVDFSAYADDEETVPLPVNTMDNSLFTFSEVLAKGFVPSVNKIFVGRTLEGKDIFVVAEDLCHVALSGKTGGGKGSLMRLIMVQLCYIGAKVLLLNPHYMRWVRAKDGPKFDEDWTPFEGINPRTGKPYLEASPVASADVEPIGKCLRWAVETLLAKRKAEGREGGKLFAPYFIVLDEWPDIASEIKKAPEYLGKLLRQGRKYGIFVIVASQDFQVKTLGLEGEGGSVRKCFLTCYYTGGDTTTAKELLYSEKPSSLPENKIGKGTVLLRCTGTKNEATLAKVPFVDNDAVYRLLGPSTFKGAKQTVVVEEPEAPLPQATMPVVPAPPQPQQASGDLTSAIERIVALYEAGKLDQETMFQLIDRLPGAQPVQETSQQAPHLRLVSSEAVEDDYHSQETERLPETQRTAKGFSRSLSPELQTTYNAFQPGMSNRDLGRLLNIDQSTAGRHIRFLIDKGAISHDRQRKLIG